jgi:hypothetical protein
LQGGVSLAAPPTWFTPTQRAITVVGLAFAVAGGEQLSTATVVLAGDERRPVIAGRAYDELYRAPEIDS